MQYGGAYYTADGVLFWTRRFDMPDWLGFVDIAIVVIIFLFAWGGSQRGFAAQLAPIFTFGLMGVFLFYAYPFIFNYLLGLFRNLHETYLTWLLMAGIVVLAFLFYVLVSKLLAGALRMHLSDRADKVNGFFLGIIRGVLTLLIVMVLFVVLGSEEIYNVLSSNSTIGRVVCREAVPLVQPHVNRAVFGQKIQAVRDRLMQREDAAQE